MAPRNPQPNVVPADEPAAVGGEALADEPAAVPVDEPVDEPLPLVAARYVGIEPVLAVIGGATVIVEPGDPIDVTVEQLEQNPVFEAWKD